MGTLGTARYAVRRGHRYRTVMNGTARDASVLSQSDLASVCCVQLDSIQIGTVCDETAIPVSYCHE